MRVRDDPLRAHEGPVLELHTVPGLTGRAVLRRLNRVEYENTIRDLLLIEIDLQPLLPEDFVDGFKSRDIPVGVVVLDSPWETNYNTFVVNEDRYPDFEGMIREGRDLASIGFEVFDDVVSPERLVRRQKNAQNSLAQRRKPHRLVAAELPRLIDRHIDARGMIMFERGKKIIRHHATNGHPPGKCKDAALLHYSPA